MIRYVFGAGKIGNETIRFLKRIQLTVNGVFDNDKKKWGTTIFEIPVFKFEKRYLTEENSLIYVACTDYWSIITQLKEEGVSDKKILVVDSILADCFLENVAYQIISSIKVKKLGKTLQSDVLFDLSGGMVLGGVEQWNYELAAKVKGKGVGASYCVVINDDNKLEDTLYPSINIKKDSDIICYVKKIIEARPKVIICNFPFSIMKAACIVKRCYDKKLKIIGIVHSDLELYYRTYDFWEKEIDLCLGISSRIEREIKINSRLADKFRKFHWKIDVPFIKKRRYSMGNDPIRIGYAGRIVEYPKRLDRLISLAQILMEWNVKFRIQIAGDGMYRTEMENIIFLNNLQNNFEFTGRLSHDQIWGFWESQDIYVNCSDYEGHSIAQAEAMALGAVPVMMDVSGAEDDIENGKSGFVVPAGDINAMAEKIDWLFRNRSQLPMLGRNARRKIEENNKLADRDLEMLLSEIIMATL